MNTQQAIGRLTKDAIKGNFKGKDYLSLNMAADSGWGDRKNTEFIDVLVFGRGNLLPYLKKGQQVYVSGECRSEVNEKNGKTYYNRKITANQIELVSSKQEESNQPIPY